MYDDEQSPPDPFVVDTIVSKANERRVFMHADFEALCSKFWQLLRSQPGANRTSDEISKEQYTQLMKRIYKVLLPLYREEEMAREVAQEWIHDARGKPTMNLTKFQKTLFRIAHSWGTHIDMEEYIELLNKVYDRITIKQVIRGETGKVETCIPRIQVEIFQENEEEDGAEWQSCLSDEYQDENYEYVHREDPEQPGVTRRFKRPLPDGLNEDDGGVMMSTRDPFFFREEVQFFKEPAEGDFDNKLAEPSEKDVVVDLLAEITDIYPMGYPTEQFICQLKNQVIFAFIKLKEDRRKAVAEMRRQMLEDGARIKVERPPEIQRDPGLIDAQGFQYEEFFTMMDTKNTVRIPTLLRVTDRSYNQMRQLFKDTNEIAIRPYFAFPTKQTIRGQGPTKMIGLSDPSTQINENYYNPALERRLTYKQIMCEMGDSVKNYCLNVNYLLDDPVYATAFRSDVNRIESSGKMSIKPSADGDISQPFEFCPVTTSFQKTMMIMLSYKFQTFWTQKVSEKQTPEEKQRDEKTFEAEQTRKTAALFKESLTSKNLTENFDEKNYLKLMRGPFYAMISREGSREDNFVTCPTTDLIDSANAQLMKILILGKPRSGKTTLAKAVSEKLDLVRVSADLWLDDLFARIKEREENPPEEEEDPEGGENEEPAEEEMVPVVDENGEPVLDENGEPTMKPKEKEPVVEDDEPKRDKKDMWLTELEYQVRNKLRGGEILSDADIDDIIREMVNSPLARTKGFIIDLNFHAKSDVEQWGVRLMEHDILTEGNELTHIIELQADDDEVKRRSRNILITPQNGKPYSAYERKERNKPKPVKLDENGDPIEEEEEVVEDGEDLEMLIAMGLKGPLVETSMVMRSCDQPAIFAEELEHYNMRERNIFDELIVKLFDSTYVKVDIAGLNPEELCESVLARVKPNSAEPLRPIATIIEEGGGAFKDLLTANLGEDDQFFLPRQWSLWKTYDPVSLYKGQVEQGLPEFAAHFGNNVFVFQNEDNMKAFVKEPRMYIEKAPEMPPQFRLAMMGPRGVGVRSQAERLEQLYGWRVVDFKQIVQEKLRDILGMPQKLPNNITEEGPCMIGLSEAELNDIKEGKPFPSWKFLPWIMEFLAIPLCVKDPPPPEDESETDAEWDEARLKQHQTKKKNKKKALEAAAKAAAEAAAAKEMRAQRRKEAIEQGLSLEELGLQESEEEKIIEDVPIERIILEADEDGKLPKVDRFILIGFPQTETHCQKLQDFNISFDRILFLSEEDNEEEPGKDLTERMTEIDEVAYEFAAELEIANAQLTVIKEWLGEDNQDRVMELKECSGSLDEVHFKIRSKLDPFFTRPDDTTDDIRVSADYEEDIHRMPRSDFGDYCPVTYVDDGYLVKGGADEEGGDPNELYVNGKRYFFAGSKEMEKFRKEPAKYMILQQQGAQLPIPPPAPKIMLTGTKCSGVTAQINMLCEKFKLETLELQESFNKKQEEQLKARQRKRLLERGFRGMPEPEDPDAPPEVDEEIVNDPEDFEKGEQDIKDLREIIDSEKGLIMDGNWRAPIKDDFGFDEEGADAAEAPEVEYIIPDLLKNARRMPEIVVILKCKEDAAIGRNYADDEEALKNMLEAELAKREKKRVDAREQSKQEKLQELDEADYEEMSPAEIQAKKDEEMQAWEEARDEEEKEAEENDDNKPELSKMREARAEKIKEAIAKDEENLESLKSKLTEDWSAVQVLELDTTKISAEFVHIKLLDMLKLHIKYRKDLIERAQCIMIKPAEVPIYEASYSYKHSKFGTNSPISPYNPKKSKNFAVLYRERIYFLSDAEEQQQFMLEPSKYTLGVEAAPLDIRVMPHVIVQGLPKSGKSTVCKKIAESTGAVHLEMEDLIEGFVDRDSSFAEKVADKLRIQGRDLDDLMLVQLIQKRVEMADCAGRGWVLENFPQTRSQAILMAKKSLLPSNVIYLNIPLEEVYKRTAPLQNEEFGSNRVILKKRIEYADKNLPQTVYFFQKFYNNVTSVDGMKSKWFLEHVSIKAISDNLKARMTFARDYQHAGTANERPCRVKNLHMDRYFFKQSISMFGYFCPVSWKNGKKFITCTHEPELAVLYKNLFYYFASEKEREIFVNNPRQFTENVIFSTERNIPRRMSCYKASEISDTEKHNLNYCSVSLTDEEKLVLGNPILVVSFKGEKYCFANEEKMVKFAMQPTRYAKTKLPVKIPPEQKAIPLYNLQKEENSITFLEQALGSVVTKGLREIGEQRLKYPTLSVKETMLKLFAIFLKTENPANTAHMKEKYMKKMQTFLEKCTVPEELHELADEKSEKKKKSKWPQFKEDYYNTLGQQYDKILRDVEKEKTEGFWSYMK